MNRKCCTYLVLYLISIVFLILGICLYYFKLTEGFYANIPLSIALAFFTSAVTTSIFNYFENKKVKEYNNKAKSEFFCLLINYSLNMTYMFITYEFKNLKNIKVDLNKNIYDQFLEKNRYFMDFRKPGKVTPNVSKMYKQMIEDFSFYLFNIQFFINSELSKNNLLHHIDKYTFSLGVIVSEISSLYMSKKEDFVSDKIANIIDLLCDIDLVKSFFEMKLDEHKNRIIRLFIKSNNS